MSINHNWLNDANLHHGVAKLRAEVEAMGEVDDIENTVASSDSAESPGQNSQVQDDIDLLWHVVFSKLRHMEQQKQMGRQLQSNVLSTEELLLVKKRINSLARTRCRMIQLLDIIDSISPVTQKRLFT